LRDEVVILELLDLKSYEEFQLPHHGLLKLLDRYPTKFFIRRLISGTKDNINYIHLEYNTFIIDHLGEQSVTPQKPSTKNNAFRLLVVNMVMNFSFKCLIFICI
jgi:hypothetical protein